MVRYFSWVLDRWDFRYFKQVKTEVRATVNQELGSGNFPVLIWPTASLIYSSEKSFEYSEVGGVSIQSCFRACLGGNVWASSILFGILFRSINVLYGCSGFTQLT